MSIRTTIAAALALTAWAAGSLAAEQEARGSYTFSGTSAGVARLVVEAPGGQVAATSWEREEIKIQAVKTVVAPDSARAGRVRRAVDRIEVQIRRQGDEVAVAVSYPRSCSEELSCSVDFKLQAPGAVEVVTGETTG